MVVDHAAGLHEGIGGGGADKLPAAFFELFGEAGRSGGDGEGGESCPGEFFGALVRGGNELPEELVEAACFLNKLAGTLGVVDGGFDFAAVAHDASVGEEAANVFVVKAGHFLEVKVGEGGAEVLALAKDSQPAETGLESFEDYFLKEQVVVVDGLGPLVVMIMPIVIKRIAPPAAGQLVRTVFESVWKFLRNAFTQLLLFPPRQALQLEQERERFPW